MTAPLRTCPEHGPFSTDGGGRCPVCGERGTRLLSGERRRRLSKFLSGALRHFPDDAGLELDDRGWTTFGEVVSAVESKYDWAGPEHVDAVIATDPKGRFERTEGGEVNEGTESDESTGGANGERVRAAYGHSVDVDLESEAQSASDSRAGSEAIRETEPTDAPVPDELYHGTAPENVEPIREEGLRPMSRQHVHLSGTREEARAVGRRHAADPVVFVVDAAAMLADGRRITKRGRETYTTERVPPRYLTLSSVSDA